MKIKKTVDAWLNEVDYSEINNYKPTDFSIMFINTIKLINGGSEENITPPVHYKMIDGLCNKNHYLVNLCHRGFSKAIALDHKLITPTGLKAMRDIHVGDIVYDRNGKETMVTLESQIHNNQCYEFELEDGTKFIANEDHIHIVERIKCTRQGSIWVEEELTTNEILSKGIWFNRKISNRNPYSKESRWFIPLAKAVQYTAKDLIIDPYTLGVIIGDCALYQDTLQAHIVGDENDLAFIATQLQFKLGNIYSDKRRSNVKTACLLKSGKPLKQLFKQHLVSHNKYIPEDYMIGSIEQRLALLQGLMDTDGTIIASGHSSFSTTSKVLAYQVKSLVKSLGGYAKVIYRPNNFKGFYNVCLHLWDMCPFRLPRKVNRWIPNKHYKRGKRVAIKNIVAIPQEVQSKCIQVASETESYLLEDSVVTHNTTLMAEYLLPFLAIFRHIPNFGEIDTCIYVADSMENGAKNLRKNLEARYYRSDFLQKYLPKAKFTDNYIEFQNNSGELFGIKLYGAKSGVRGVKIFGKRPALCLMDDLLSDEDASSPTVIEKIKDTIYKGVMPALHPTRKKVVFNGTPFNKADPIYEAVESGEWYVNVYPVCEEFPCSKENFKGSWEDRFTYESVLEKYNLAVGTGQVKAFRQEYMLRIASEEDRMVSDSDIRWFNSYELLENKQKYNFYITTDFATSTQKRADYTVVGVWAVDINQNHYLVDGVIGRQLMNQTFDDIFRLVQKYQPLSVGIETSGQQGAFISLIRQEMNRRNTWFTLASAKGSKKVGIPSVTNKMNRFRLVIPMFKENRIYLPKDLKNTTLIQQLLDELSMVTIDGIKSKHDDTLDMVSQLGQMHLVYPDKYQSKLEKSDDSPLNYFHVPQIDSEDYIYSSYLG